MPEKVALQFSKLQHIGIPVNNVEKTIQFYQLLGFEVAMDRPFDHDEGAGRCVMMQRGGIVLEFYQLPGTAVACDIITRGDGHIDHLAFDVNNIDQVYDEIKKAGFGPLQPAPVFLDFWDHGVKFFHILGPDGERLEFNKILQN